MPPAQTKTPQFIPDSAPAFIPDTASAAREAPPTLGQRAEQFAQKTALPAIENFAAGLGGGAIGLMNTGSEWAQKHLPAPLTSSWFGFGKPVNEQQFRQQYVEPQTTAQKAGYGTEKALEFMIPGSAEEAAAEHAPAALKPIVRLGTSALSAGAVNKAQGGSFKTGAVGGAIGSGAGQLAEKAAVPLMETALRVGKRERGFGKAAGSIGRAALQETKGVRPETIERTGREAIESLSPQLSDIVAQSQTPVSLAPARAAVSKPLAEAGTNEALGLHSQLSDMADFLQKGKVSGETIPEEVSPSRALQLKRGFSDEYLGKWNPDVHAKTTAAGRQAYRALAEGIHQAAPGSRELDWRISNLIPVVRRAESVGREAPMLERIGGRFARPTGALTGMGLGGYAGYRETGSPEGAILGGLTGLIAPEVLSSPEGQAAVARMFHGAGNLRPLVGAALQAEKKK